MVKVRLTYVQDSDEEKAVLEVLKQQFNVIQVSREYKGRGNSQYSNIYVDVEVKGNEKTTRKSDGYKDRIKRN